MGRLTDKVAVITGGSRGFGRAMALLFAREGADVVIGYRTAEREAAAAADEVQEAGRRALVVRADIARPADTAGLAEQALRARSGGWISS